MHTVKLILLSIGMIFLSGYLFAQDSTRLSGNQYFTLLGNGFYDEQLDNAVTNVGRKWKIKSICVGGCQVPKTLKDSINRANKIVKAQLDSVYGKGWQDIYYEEISLEYKRLAEIVAVLNKKGFIKKEKHALDKIGITLRYYMIPIEDSKEDYLVKVWGKTYQKEGIQRIVYYTLEINCKSHKIRKICKVG